MGRDLECCYRRVCPGNNDIRSELHESGDEIGKPIQAAVCESIVDHDVLAVDPSQIPQRYLKGVSHTQRGLARGTVR